MRITKRQLRRILKEYEYPGSIPAKPWDPVKGYAPPPEGYEGYFDNTVSKSVYRPIQPPDSGQPTQPQSSGPRAEVEWDLGDTEFEGMPYDQGIKAAGLPAVVELPADMDEYELNDWLSDEYGFTHFGWEPIKENKRRITKRQLKRIIKEEKLKLLRENVNSPTSVDQAVEWLYGEPGRMNDPRAHRQHFSVIEKAFPPEAAALRAGTVPDSARDPGSPFRVVWDYIADIIADREDEYAWEAFKAWWDGRPEDAFDEYLGDQGE